MVALTAYSLELVLTVTQVCSDNELVPGLELRPVRVAENDVSNVECGVRHYRVFVCFGPIDTLSLDDVFL